jgi:endonuclease IV
MDLQIGYKEGMITEYNIFEHYNSISDYYGFQNICTIHLNSSKDKLKETAKKVKEIDSILAKKLEYLSQK